MEDEESAPAELGDTLALLGRLKGELDECDAEISELIPHLEAALDYLRLGVPISYKVSEDFETRTTTYLSFLKIGRRWRLCVESGPEESPDHISVTPLSDLPRDERVEMFELVPQILKAAVHEVGTRIAERRRVIASTKNLVQTVGNFVAERS